MKEIEKSKNDLFPKIVSILEKAKANVVRSVNTNMVIAYWQIGREIVLNIQDGDIRADYGKKVIDNLSRQLNSKYGSGFSSANLKNFRAFYLTFREREKSYPLGSKSETSKSYPLGDEFSLIFNPNLSWSHYRAIMRVKDKKAREFYEKEAIECGWNKRELERQIHSYFYERSSKSNQSDKLLSMNISKENRIKPDEILTSPNVLEFLNIPDNPKLYESDLEEAIINNLRLFLLEIGKGFSFVARQKKLQYQDKQFFVDLVFYNYYLKCFVLIDLKISANYLIKMLVKWTAM